MGFAPLKKFPISSGLIFNGKLSDKFVENSLLRCSKGSENLPGEVFFFGREKQLWEQILTWPIKETFDYADKFFQNIYLPQINPKKSIKSTKQTPEIIKKNNLLKIITPKNIEKLPYFLTQPGAPRRIFNH